jgi:hypothetical protein
VRVNEVWKAVPGYEGLYEVSDMGRVRSLDRVVERLGRWGKVVAQRVAGRVMRPGPHKGGYGLLHLYGARGRRTATVHGLVAAAFLGPRPEGSDVCHNDGNPKNCRLDNLRYGTRAENDADKDRHGTRPLGEAHAAAKIDERAVAEIRALRGAPQKEIADRFGVTFSNVSAIQLRKSWRHV